METLTPAEVRAATPSARPFLVIERVNPEHCVVGDRKPGVFKAHQGDMIHERKIARKPTAGFRNDWRRYSVQHYADFHPLLAILELQYAKYGFVKRALSLDDVVMDMVHGQRRSEYRQSDVDA